MNGIVIISIIFLFFLLPFALIVIGFLRRYKDNGIILFMIGFGCLTAFLITSISKYDVLFLLLWLPCIWLAYHFFRWIQTRPFRTYINCSRRMILAAQDTSLPSCEKIILDIIENTLKQNPEGIPKDPTKAAETIVYRIALEMLDSANYRLPTGILSSTGNQLLHICRYCLDYFLSKEYITREDFAEHNDYLAQCVYHFENYSVFDF